MRPGRVRRAPTCAFSHSFESESPGPCWTHCSDRYARPLRFISYRSFVNPRRPRRTRPVRPPARCTRGAACGGPSARGSDGIGGSCVPAHRLTSLRRGTTPQLVSRHAKSRRGTEPLPDRASSRGSAQAWSNRSRGGGGAQLTRSCNIFWWRQRRLAPQLLRGNRGDRAIFAENIHWVIGIR